MRAFSSYFGLVNLAERVHRIRRRASYRAADAPPQPGSLEAVLRGLKDEGMGPDEVTRALARCRIAPVFTAHPTEAVRRSLLTKGQRIARTLLARLIPGREELPLGESAVAEAQAAGRPVFVDFTAAWCVSCQVNKLGTLSDSRVRDVFAQQDVALFRADFTNRDPVIADALARHGAAGVPLYLVYPPESGDPEVLPPLLTSGIVIRAVNDAVN